MIRELKSTLSQKGFFANSENKHFTLSKVPKQQWVNLTFMDRVLSRNQIKTEHFDEEADAIPFFMDFGDSMLQQMKDQVDGKFLQDRNKDSKIIKKRDDNEFLDESLGSLEKLLGQLPATLAALDSDHERRARSTSESLLALLKQSSSFEIDHFFKQHTMFDSDNCVRLVKLFSLILETPSDDFDLKCVLLKTFLEAAADQLIRLRTGSPVVTARVRAALARIKSVLDACQSQNEESFAEVASVLERIVNRWRPEKM